MKIFLSRFISLIVAIVVVLSAASKPAHADTYQIFDLGTGHRRNPVGIEASGAVIVFSLVGLGGACTQLGVGCYETWVDGTLVSQSNTNPNPVYDNGAACAIAVSPLLGSVNGTLPGTCNNGHEVYGTTRNAPVPYRFLVFDGPSLTTDLVASGLELDRAFLNSVGDFAFSANQGISGIDADGEIYQAIDLTTTPEPGSILLLGTGALAIFGTMRRRWLHLS